MICRLLRILRVRSWLTRNPCFVCGAASCFRMSASGSRSDGVDVSIDLAACGDHIDEVRSLGLARIREEMGLFQ